MGCFPKWYCAALSALCLLVTASSSSAVGGLGDAVQCCSAGAAAEGGDDDACVTLASGAPLQLSASSWNGLVARAPRWVGFDLCGASVTRVPEEVRTAGQRAIVGAHAVPGMPQPMLRQTSQCPAAGFVSLLSPAAGCEAVFGVMRAVPRWSGPDEITAVIKSCPTQESSFCGGAGGSNVTVIVACAPTPRADTFVASGAGVAVEATLRLRHPGACRSGDSDPTVSLGDLALAAASVAIALVAAYHVSINAFVHQRRGLGLLEPLPTLARRCCCAAAALGGSARRVPQGTLDEEAVSSSDPDDDAKEDPPRSARHVPVSRRAPSDGAAESSTLDDRTP